LDSGSVRLTKLLASVGLAASNTEGQRLIESGAVHINEARITDPKHEISARGEYLLKVGKRRFLKLVIS
jgi:tyrosyl-tRNA synthetase